MDATSRAPRRAFACGGALLAVCALSLPARGASAPNIESVRWADVSLPGTVCGASTAIKLRGDGAVVNSRRWPGTRRVHVAAGLNPVVYGDLEGDKEDAAALSVDCNNGGGTADGVLAYAQVIFLRVGASLRVVGVVSPREQKPSEPPTLLTVKIQPGKVVAHEVWYRGADATCCPSGRATTIWTYTHGSLQAGMPVITKAP